MLVVVANTTQCQLPWCLAGGRIGKNPILADILSAENPLAELGLRNATLNPYSAPSDGTPVASSRFRRRLRVAGCVIGWLTGTLLLTILFAIDQCFDLELPGGFLYVTIIASVGIAALSSSLAPVHIGWRVVVFFLGIGAMLVQFIALAVWALATSGFEGIH